MSLSENVISCANKNERRKFMKDDLVIRGGEQITKPQNADVAGVSTNGGGAPSLIR